MRTGKKCATDKEVEKAGEKFIVLLSKIAFSSMSKEQCETIEAKGVEEVKEPGYPLLIDETLQLDLLVKNDSSYHFIHPTLQQYFTACHLVRLLKLKNPQAQTFICKNKYNPHLQQVFCFAAGLCSLEDKRLQDGASTTAEHLLDSLFGAYLDEGTKDLIGVYEAQLGVQMLEESDLPASLQSKILQKRISFWTCPETHPDLSETHFNKMTPILSSCPKYTNAYCIPYMIDHINEGNAIQFCSDVQRLKCFIPSVIFKLMALLESKNPKVVIASVNALASVDPRFPNFLMIQEAIFALLQSSDEHLLNAIGARIDIFYNFPPYIAKAGRQLLIRSHPIAKGIALVLYIVALSQENSDAHKMALIRVFKDADLKTQQHALALLADNVLRKDNKTVDMLFVKEIVNFLNSSDNSVKKHACIALSFVNIQDNAIREEIVKTLESFPIELIEEACITMWAFEARTKVIRIILSLLISASASAQESGCRLIINLKFAHPDFAPLLTKLLQGKDFNIRKQACQALEVMDALESSTIHEIIQLLSSPTPSVAATAKKTLVKFKISDLVHIQAIIALLKDSTSNARYAAHQTLLELLREPAAIPHIALLLSDSELDCKLIAFEALMKFYLETAVSPIPIQEIVATLPNAEKLLTLIEKYHEAAKFYQLAPFLASLPPGISPSPFLFDNLLKACHQEFLDRWTIGLHAFIALCNKFGDWKNDGLIFTVYAKRTFELAMQNNKALHMFNSRLHIDGVELDVSAKFANQLASQLSIM